MYIKNFFLSIFSTGLLLCSSFHYTYVDKNINSPIFLVNNNHKISASYKPELKKADIFGSERYLQVTAIDDATKMFNAAKQDGILLKSFSSYRSHTTQNTIYARKVSQNNGDIAAANAYVALPGSSEHQLGLAIDIIGRVPKLNDKFANTTEGIWLNDNAYKYGFIVRYKDKHKAITGIEFEPWHIRYVGKKAAYDIHKSDISLEKYVSLQRLKKYKELLNIR